jgi:hypothetical protein
MMALWTAFKGSKVGMWLIFVAAVVWGLLLLVGRLMSAGAAKEQAAQAARNDEVRRQADEVRNDVDAAGDADVDRLRDKWTRQ